MEPNQDETIRIASEGLRLVLRCKVPQFNSLSCVVGPNHTTQPQQVAWSKRLLLTLPPLLDWVEEHRDVLLREEKGLAAQQEFQRYFVLVFLEQLSGMSKIGAFQVCQYAVDDCELEDRLRNFKHDVRRIIEESLAVRNWLFHYYGSGLGLQGWLTRPGDLHSVYRLFDYLKHYAQMDVLFGQKMMSFLECLGEELLGFPKNSEYQTLGILVLIQVMEINHERKVYTHDAEKILKKALSLNREVVNEYGDELWTIMYYSVCSVRAANISLDDQIMLDLLAHLNGLLMEKEQNPTVEFGNGPRAYLMAVTLLLLVDVPEVGVKDSDFEVLTIRGRSCSRDQFRRHVKSCVRTGDNLHVSMNIRLRIAKMIPKLFAGFSPDYYVDVLAYRCLELLTWMTMTPTSQARQHKNARALTLERLVVEMKRLCGSFIKNPSEYFYDEQDLRDLYENLPSLLSVVEDAVQLLPNTGWFRRWRSNMRSHVAVVFIMVEMLKTFRA